MYYYWIINVGAGRKNGYSFSVKVYCDEKCPPCGCTRFEDRIVECAKKRGLFNNKLESYGCCVSEPYSEEDIYDGRDENAIELSELNYME